MTDGVAVQHLLRERVAEEVRALLARKMMTGADLAVAIGRSPMYVSRRIRGEVAFDLDDMQRLSEALDVPLISLLPTELRSEGSRLNHHLGELVPSDPNRSAEPPRRHTTTRPFSPTRRDPVRPVSAIPATKRRPNPTRPGSRMITAR